MATLAEGMALADRAGLQQRDVMEILALTNMACPLFLEKGNGKKKHFNIKLRLRGFLLKLLILIPELDSV